eukprot:TRINITY_DN18459_c0_g1_i1.p1 TRINITY_DN18459_c0_g1~~TRINITY_DN18459_c0_g1_i1.p1  ORF type:complete len:506 (+),score=65.57 TRINITY_DN18459_c0_g1_i1:48-1565(+)
MDQSAVFQLHLRMPTGEKLQFEAHSHDSIAAVRQKVRMKLNGVTFRDDNTGAMVEMYSYGNGLIVVVGNIRWKPVTSDGGTGRVTDVHLEGRFIRLGGNLSTGVTIPKDMSPEESQVLISRLRDLFEFGRVRHNIPPPVPLRRDVDPKESPLPGHVTLQNGARGVKYERDPHIHAPTCSGRCMGKCYDISKPVGTWGALLRGAAARNDDEEVMQLLAAGAKVDDLSSTGQSALHHAARHGHISTIQLLLSSGAYPGGTDKSGNTPSKLAKQNSHHEAASILDKASHPRGVNFRGNNYSAKLRDGDPVLGVKPSWELRQIRSAHSKDMTDLSTHPWDVGTSVTINNDPGLVERVCISSWAGWTPKKRLTVGRSGTIVNKKSGTSNKYKVLLEVSFPDSDLQFWYPTSAIVPVYGNSAGEKAIYSATAKQRPFLAEERWRINFAGRDLADSEVLWETGVTHGDTLRLVKPSAGYQFWGATGNPPDETPSRPTHDNNNNLPDGFIDLY